jgi:hypothetical protein
MGACGAFVHGTEDEFLGTVQLTLMFTLHSKL